MNPHISFPSQAWPVIVRHANALLSGAIVVLGLALLLALRLGWLDIFVRTAGATTDAPAEEPAALRTSVQLPPEKLAASDLTTALVQLQPIQPMRTVPGSITYDAAKRLPVNSPVAGVVGKVFVEPADEVTVNQPLAELSSPEVGLARDEVQKREADLELARHEEGRLARIAENVEALLALLQKKPTVAALESALEERSLGDYREKIVGAYSKLALAERIEKDTSSLGASALSGRLVEERKSTREVAAAQFATACDLARFEARHEQEKAKTIREQAERLLAVSQQSLKNLLGPLADMTPITDRTRLSELRLLAPLDGRIEERHAVRSSRVTAGSPLFLIADTSALWVSAEIHERDWAALDVTPHSPITVRVPALNNQELSARVRFVGHRSRKTRGPSRWLPTCQIPPAISNPVCLCGSMWRWVRHGKRSSYRLARSCGTKTSRLCLFLAATASSAASMSAWESPPGIASRSPPASRSATPSSIAERSSLSPSCCWNGKSSNQRRPPTSDAHRPH
jgi:cobalt-zinc-cadmium efflux system membrane fusion protein